MNQLSEKALQLRVTKDDVIAAAERCGFEVEKFEKGLVVYGHHRIGEYEEELILNLVNNRSICKQLYQKYRKLQEELIKSPSDYACMRLLCMARFMKAFKPVLYDYEPFPSEDETVRQYVSEIMAYIYGIEVMEYGDEASCVKLYCFPFTTSEFGTEEYSFSIDYEKPVCPQIYQCVNSFHPLKGHDIKGDRNKAKRIADELSMSAKPLKQFAHDLRTIFNEETRKDWMHDFTDYLTDNDVAKRNATVTKVLKENGFKVTEDYYVYTMTVPELEYGGRHYISSGCMTTKDALAFAYSFLRMFSEASVKELIESDPLYFKQLGDEEYVLNLPKTLDAKAEKAKKELDAAFWKWNDWASA